jgi:hypothetical protein
MNHLEIVEKYYHKNGKCAPFVIAIVDDPAHNDTKLVIMFDEEEFTAVISLDTLIESEDITTESNGYAADKYDKALRNHLWDIESDGTEDEEEEEDSELF